MKVLKLQLCPYYISRLFEALAWDQTKARCYTASLAETKKRFCTPKLLVLPGKSLCSPNALSCEDLIRSAYKGANAYIGCSDTAVEPFFSKASLLVLKVVKVSFFLLCTVACTIYFFNCVYHFSLSLL